MLCCCRIRTEDVASVTEDLSGRLTSVQRSTSISTWPIGVLPYREPTIPKGSSISLSSSSAFAASGGSSSFCPSKKREPSLFASVKLSVDDDDTLKRESSASEAVPADVPCQSKWSEPGDAHHEREDTERGYGERTTATAPPSPPASPSQRLSPPLRRARAPRSRQAKRLQSRAPILPKNMPNIVACAGAVGAAMDRVSASLVRISLHGASSIVRISLASRGSAVPEPPE